MPTNNFVEMRWPEGRGLRAFFSLGGGERGGGWERDIYIYIYLDSGPRSMARGPLFRQGGRKAMAREPFFFFLSFIESKKEPRSMARGPFASQGRGTRTFPPSH